MNRQSWTRLAYSRPGGAITILLLFTLCTTPFMLLGLQLNTHYSSITSLPLYPNAQALTSTTKGTVGMMSTPTTSDSPPPNSIPNYTFTTTDAPASVVKFYQNSLTQIYGSQAVRTSTTQLDQTNTLTTITAARRPSSLGAPTEQTTVTINTTADGVTHVLVMVDPH